MNLDQTPMHLRHNVFPKWSWNTASTPRLIGGSRISQTIGAGGVSSSCSVEHNDLLITISEYPY